MPVETYKEVVGDDLEDGLEYEVPESESENVYDAENDILEDESSDEAAVDTSVETPSKDAAAKKRKAPSADKKLHDKKKMKMEFDSQKKKDLSSESADVIAEKIASKIAQANKDLSPLELTELYIDKKHIKSTSGFTEARSLDNLGKFISGTLGSLLVSEPAKKKKKKNPKRQDKVAKELAKKQAEADKLQEEEGKQYIVVLSMSAIRACDVHRATRELGSIKLIKKNKLKDDLAILDKSNARVLATTSGRLVKILNEPESPISEQNLRAVIVDNSYLDSKKQNIFDVSDTVAFLKRVVGANDKAHIYLY